MTEAAEGDADTTPPTEENQEQTLDDFDSYEEYYEQVIVQEGATSSDEIDSRKVFLIRYGFYAFVTILVLTLIALFGWLVYEVIIYLIEYTAENLNTQGAILFPRLS